MSTLFKRGHCWVCGEPLLSLAGAWTRYSHLLAKRGEPKLTFRKGIRASARAAERWRAR